MVLQGNSRSQRLSKIINFRKYNQLKSELDTVAAATNITGTDKFT